MRLGFRVELWGEDPVPQGSKTGFVIPGTNRVSMTDANAKKLKPWRERVHDEAESVMTGEPFEGAVQVSCLFVFERPKGHYGTGKNEGVVKLSAPNVKTSKPDIDKLARAILDGITGVVIKDDSQVVRLRCEKVYGPQGGCVVAVTETGEA